MGAATNRIASTTISQQPHPAKRVLRGGREETNERFAALRRRAGAYTLKPEERFKPSFRAQETTTRLFLSLLLTFLFPLLFFGRIIRTTRTAFSVFLFARARQEDWSGLNGFQVLLRQLFRR